MDSVLLFIVGVAVMVVGIALSIGLHEVGHLVPAKLFGVRVSQYMIGFGKTLFSFRRGETEYGLKAIPLGGYISMSGMFPPAKTGGKARTASTGFFQTLVQDARSSSAETILAGEEHRAFYQLPIWKRIIIMMGGPFMNLVIGIVLFGVVLMGFGAPFTGISEVSQCVVPAASAQQTCQPSDPRAPAAIAGFQRGDILLGANGKTITSWTDWTTLFQKSPGKTLSVTVDRAGKRVVLAVTPLRSERYVTDAKGKVVVDAAGNKETQDVGFVGLGPNQNYQLIPQPVSAVLPAVGAQTGAVFSAIIDLPNRMVGVWNAAFSSAPRAADSPVGLVGVGRAAGEVASMNNVTITAKVYTLIELLASLNIALFAFNLIPLLPLDGGHIIGAIWEGVRRTWAKIFRRRDPGPVDMAKLMPLTFAVVIVLGAMSLLLVYADIVKPINIG